MRKKIQFWEQLTLICNLKQMRANVSCCFITLLIQNQECISLTQAGTDTGGHCTHAHTRILSLTLCLSLPPPKQQKLKPCQRKKVCYDIDQNPWNQQSIWAWKICCFDLESMLKKSIIMFWYKEFWTDSTIIFHVKILETISKSIILFCFLG